MFKYRSGEYDPTPYINKIEDDHIKVLRNLAFRTVLYEHIAGRDTHNVLFKQCPISLNGTNIRIFSL
jgi:hypothetical protein